MDVGVAAVRLEVLLGGGNGRELHDVGKDLVAHDVVAAALDAGHVGGGQPRERPLEALARDVVVGCVFD